MMNYSLKLVGFLQAVGVGAYIALFATLAYTAQAWARAHAFAIHPVIGITSFLLAFVISALIFVNLSVRLGFAFSRRNISCT